MRFQRLVQGVNAVCAAKSAAGSSSTRWLPTSAGGCASVGESTTSTPDHAAATARVSCCTAASAVAYASPLTARPRSRSHRVSGTSRCSRSGGTGAWSAPTDHSAANASQRSAPNGGGISTTSCPSRTRSSAAARAASAHAGCTGAPAAITGSSSSPTRSRRPSGGVPSRAVKVSPGQGRASTSRNAAVSRTDRVRTPCVASPAPSTPYGPGLTSPRDGLSPTSPHALAGMRSEPPPSLPCATGTTRAATAAAAPPLDPPADRARSHGVRAVGPTSGSV